MNNNFLVVLFKDKLKRKIINKFITQKKANDYFNKLIQESNEVIFPKEFQNGIKSEFEIALLSKNKSDAQINYIKDDLGRQIKLELESDDYIITKISKYKKEELISDYKTKNKITSKTLIKKYLSGDGIKMISKINNKIVVQNDDDYNLFTLKNDYDANRFVDCLSEYFLNKRKMDCIIVKDVSNAQRKYLYELLEEKGFPKSYLFRHSTTHPK